MFSYKLVAFLALYTLGELSSAREYGLPIAKIYQVQSNNRLKPWNRFDSNSETTIENVENLRLDCTANYPVQWIYTGNGIPAYSSMNKYSRSNNHGETSTEYTATVSINPLKEYHTGKYICSPADSIDARTFFYIYVPGQNLFTSPSGHNIQLPKNDSTILIPCTVSHPHADVTLDRSEGEVLRRVRVKSSDAVTYDPKLGFRVNINKVENPEGTYVCTARFGSSVRSVEYHVKSSYNSYNFQSDQAPARIEKCKKKCGENAYCDIENGRETCKCLPEFNGDPDLKCVIKCDAHTDCPDSMSCFVDRQCRNPCQHSQVGCGVGALCKVEKHRPVCYCPPDWIGDETIQCFNTVQGQQPSGGRPDNSRPQSPSQSSPKITPVIPATTTIKCSSNTDCMSNQTCIRSTASGSTKTCVDPCLSRRCGRNAACVVDDHRSACECLPGFQGDSRIECQPIKLEIEPSFEPLILQADQPKNSNSEFKRRCAKPEQCGLNSDCRMDNVGIQQCLCAEGFLGQPPKCRPECRQNKDCPDNHVCVSDNRVNYPTCAKTCGSRVCGAHADCAEFDDGNFECYCPEALYGDPLIKCETKEQRLGKDCSTDYDCGVQLRCEIGADERKCVDPCEKKYCGKDLTCTAENHSAKCVCPGGFTGNEYVGCNKDVNHDQSLATRCANLTCGTHGECRINQNGLAKCFCQSGFIGRPPACISECLSNSDCPTDLTCVQRRCRHRCEGCGKNTKCRVAPNLDRSSVCSCLEGFEGNPYAGCTPV